MSTFFNIQLSNARQVFPEMSDNKELVGKMVDDMQSSGILTKGSYMSTMMSSNGMLSERTTKFGNSFLDFIHCWKGSFEKIQKLKD